MKITFLDVLDRAHDGPYCSGKEWDMRVVPGAVAKILKKYELQGTHNRENPVNCDDSLADRFWEAGLEMAVDVGMLCSSTERVIKFSREELLYRLKEAPDHWHAGIGLDACDYRARKPEDPRPPTTVLGCIGIVVPEELFVPVMQSHCQNRLIDGTVAGILTTVYGREVRSGTPYETLVGALESRLMKEAMTRAGRPGMPVHTFSSGALEYAQLGGFGAPGGYSIEQVLVQGLVPSPLKVDYHIFQKIAHGIIHCVARSSAEYAMIGGYEGGPEGCALAAVAAGILLSIVMQAYVVSPNILDTRYNGNTGRDAIWALSVARQAIHRNTHLLTYYLSTCQAGPLTETLLREITVGAISGTVSGASVIKGTRSAGGGVPLHTTGLESGYEAEVAKAAAGMTRAQANKIVNRILPKYEDELKRPNRGAPFPECFDVKTVKPKKEWLDIYKKIKKEAAELGVPFVRFE